MNLLLTIRIFNIKYTDMEILDLHYVEGDPDFGITAEGVLFKNENDIISRIDRVKGTVKTINLKNQYSIREIPAVLGQCKLLEDINISHTPVREIPDFLFALPNLRHFSCCCSELSAFPLGIFKTQKLESLHIRMNKDWVMPKELTSQQIQSMQNLKSFAIDLYTPAALPSNLGKLQNLERLALAAKHSEGDVPPLPPSLKNHPSLKEVSFTDPFFHKYRKKLDLDSAGKLLASCGKLESLILAGFDAGKGHQALSRLAGLKTLELGHLLVEGNIFNSIANLQKLEKLGIWGSEFRISEIPDIFANMKELQKFSFAGNMAAQLPKSIYTLEKLKEIAVGSTGISMLDDKIGSLQNLKRIHIYDNLLSSLPDSIFSLPQLSVLNIEENIFNAEEIKKLKGKINSLKQKGRIVEFYYDRQGHRQMVKKLRVLNVGGKIDSMDIKIYTNYCLNAIKESPYAIKYVSAEKIKDPALYLKLCKAAVGKSSLALENININVLGKKYYFSVCMEAAKCGDIGHGFKLIKDGQLTDGEFIQVCMEAALNNKTANFIVNLETEAFQKRFSREIYERICWVAALKRQKAGPKAK